ncbi:uncharacterized protein LOC132298889 [Cornus florida]|uniref:uncharacterized protein LOC132298889 n=1 Tax=Cornus florida TaxID=4283 RepID=UPI00289C43A4|nr:uncharacterized protein LOC132298889 [Cornus florida]
MSTLIESESSSSTVNFADHLPLQLIQSETIPPAPTRSESAIDWLPDFAGYSWIAYAASSLLVISHFPSPLSEEEALIGPIFRQVIELSSDGTDAVSAVAWSPATPSLGDLAAALDNCIGLFSHNSATSSGSFCWSQAAVLVQSTKVEAIKWTGSGDGIVSGGIDVVLWRNKGRSWEIAWKFKTELPQTLVSATWSIEEPSATAPLGKLHGEGPSSLIREATKCVFVCYSDRNSIYVKAELHHPLPVSMIQWRPSTRRQSKKDDRHSLRHVLLTCCLDGTVRLWSEIDDGRVKKTSKDINDQKTRRSFHVVAVIEINQALNGMLGSDIYVRWAIESDGLISTGKGDIHYFSSEGNHYDKAGWCEWLIGFGPKMFVTYWAIHCLDDVAPMRFPRVTLWKREELKDSEEGNRSLLLNKVVISRNQVCSPPTTCSLIRLLPCNSFGWLLFYTQTSTDSVDVSLNKPRTNNLLSCCAGGVLNIDGHTGKILQVAVHPYICEAGLVVSLDSDGLLLFWSVSTISNCIMGLPTLNPSWKLSGKFVLQDSYPIYTSMSWAPAVLDEDLVLLMGHAGGIDCFIVKISKSEEEKMLCHNLCTIPFTSHGYEVGPANICSLPLPSTCNKTFVSNIFLLLAAWKKGFHALSWKIIMHSYDLSGSCCGCNIDAGDTAENSTWKFESIFGGKKYCVAIDPCSSVLPHPHNHDQVTCFAMISPNNYILFGEQKWISVNASSSNYSAYQMVTGCTNGSLKLWRSLPAKPPSSNSQWELVGKLAAHQGPIIAISFSDCGQKIATVCPTGHSKKFTTLNIWNCVHLTVAGSFILEDTLSLDGDFITLNWLTMGNGQLLLGVCLQNELKVYAQRRCGGQSLLEHEQGKLSERNIWFCIAFAHSYPPIRDFLWGPRMTAVVVYDDYFCLFSEWIFLGDKEHQTNCNLKISKGKPLDCNGGSDNHMLTAIFTDCEICDLKRSSTEDIGKQCWSRPRMKMNIKNDILSSIFIASVQQKNNLAIASGFWRVSDVLEKLCGALPVYHPEALLMNICSGYWKRAYVALQHLVEYLTSSNAFVKRYRSASSGHIISPVHLSNYLEGFLSTSSSDKAFQWGEDASLISSSSQLQKGSTHSAYSWGSDNAFTSSSTKSELQDFVEPIEKLYDFAAITNTEKMQVLAVIDLLHDISNPHSTSVYGSLDEPGRRFWVAVRFKQLYFVRRFGRLAFSGELAVDSGLVAWAFHSDCQENLLGSLLHNESSWQEMRSIGFGFWYTNATQLRLKMEKLARQQYLKNKDPKACALLYIALNRLQVLAGLFKISKDEKDKPLVGFLSRNFQEDKNKAAALKNAFVLMGRHQLELAIAFFLLGGDTSSAVNVCAKNLGDEQLALVICRLVDGYGGPLERNLISKFMLPSAIEKGDYWLSSFLEWVSGNYSQSFLNMVGVQMATVGNKSALLSDHASFLDPSIGEYCLMLATKNSMKIAVGEQNAAILGRWAILMSATALNRCGMPLEALDCLSSPLSIFGGSDQHNVSEIANHELLNEMLKPCPDSSSSNWISADVTFSMESDAKLDLAMKYVSKLWREHPSWPDTNMASTGACTFSESEIHQYKILLENFQHKLTSGLAFFEQKFSLIPLHIINMIIIFLCNNGLVFIGYHTLQDYTSHNKSNTSDSSLLYPILHKLLLKTTEEISCLFSRFTIACSKTCSQLNSYSTENNLTVENRCGWLTAWGFYTRDLIWSLWSLRATFKLLSVSCAEDFVKIPFLILDLFEFYVYFASAWTQRNFRGLILIVKPLIITYTKGHASYEINMEDLKKVLHQIAELLFHNILVDDIGGYVQVTKPTQHEQDEDIMYSVTEAERWQILEASLWGNVSGFLKHHLNSLSEKLNDSYSFGPNCRLSSLHNFATPKPEGNNTQKHMELVSVVLAKSLMTTCVHISSYHAKQLASFLQQKAENGLSTPTLLSLEEFSRSQPRALHKHVSEGSDNLHQMNSENELSALKTLWYICADSKILCGGFTEENSKWLRYIKQKPSKGWSEIYTCIMGECEAEETCNQDGKHGNIFASNGAGSSVGHLSPDDHSLLSSVRKDTLHLKEVIPFQKPKEICKRNGELLEALCINSIDQQEVAVASNRKGIIFFNWDDGLPLRDQSDYILAEADWPQNGWAGSESTPVPTCVSPGVGLGTKKGAHLGLGGATVGVDSLARPGRDLTSVGSYGVPGYAGIGTSGLGWGIQEDFEEFVDPPATVEKTNTRAFSSHPSRPFFLVGSSNTHIYLWEFGKNKATATYGVLPAANVPPPYALASISAVQFDHYGQRFATAALDGTVCTWQLEVGGRSNIRPTESSLCFNNHASDVTYVTASGSIIAAAGHSSNGVNVVIWDMLAPPSTSRASIMCHEGGACSLSVFDNDIGSGSISPLIVTGGRGGDVGVHDFRYIATGRTKRHKHSDSGEQNIIASSTADLQIKSGNQNTNGMLWYLPKAHLGDVTKISTIPNTSFFLTGSKDGDVKLWDAKRAKLVYHWSKLHERHTFMQPSSRGFGGVVRAAVTDIQVVSHGFLSCGGDGSVKLVQLKDILYRE